MKDINKDNTLTDDNDDDDNDDDVYKNLNNIFLNRKNRIIIAIEGEIGAGKSYLSKKLEQRHDNIKTYYEDVNEKFLKLFYENPFKYGWAFQWGMLQTRLYQFKLAQYDKTYSTSGLSIWDRSMLGDYIFALWNHLTGGINKKEMVVYEDNFGSSLSNLGENEKLNIIDLFMFLNDEPKNCKERVETSRKNNSEKNIPLNYYEGIDDLHFTFFCQLLKDKKNVLVMNWSDYENDVNVLQQMNRKFSGTQMQNTVATVDNIVVATNNDCSYEIIVYRTEIEILRDYKKIKNRTLFVNSKVVVYIPSDIMIVDPHEKGVTVDISKSNYDIKFYKNPYKRLFFYYISKNSDVMFYVSK